MRSFVKVRGVNVLVTETSICQIYDAPYYYRDYIYQKNLKEFKNIDTNEVLIFLMTGKRCGHIKRGQQFLRRSIRS
ncbi:hypothetical protein Goarm_004809 [Gossypium armourianum]|uniref:Uncharacterized protein n=1 Tax=Gossypium armourianum TaxID=34283 RepID=A0A7J9JXY0_9ROSI|nr:hypothetical protein [Gossypium armourianum]